MRKSVVTVFACLAAGAVWAAESPGQPNVVEISGPFVESQLRSLLGLAPPAAPVEDDTANYRKPILKAAGTQRVAPGQERITIPVDGVAYEVVVAKPHPMGLLIPVEHH